MRIGLFSDTYFPHINGVSTSINMLKRALEKKGHIVYIVTTNDSAIKYDYDEKEKILRIPGIKTGIYNYRLSQIYPIKVINQIKGWHLDVIHSHTEFGVGTFARLFAKQFAIPLVHTYHTWYEDYAYYLTKGHAEKASKKVVEYLTKFYCDTTATELIVPTKKIYDLFREKYKFEKNINIIPTGIEVERFFPENIDSKKLSKLKRDLNIGKKDFIIIFVGRLAVEKNIEFLLESQRELLNTYKNIKLLIVGDGPAREKYEKLANELNIINNIIFTGKVSWQEIPYYYNCADLFATASTSETQGLTVLEAMASRVVPLCINDEAFTSTVIDNLNGRIFNNKSEFIAYVIDLYKDKKAREYLARQAKVFAERCSTKYFAESALDVYERAIQEKNNSKNFLSILIDKVRGDK